MRYNFKIFSSWLLVLLVTLLLTTSIDAYQNQNDLITESCRATSDPRTCESTLRSDPRSSSADSRGLALIMVAVLKSDYNNALRYVNQLIVQTPWTQGDRLKTLRKCEELYKFVLSYDVPEAVEAIEKGDKKFGVDAMVDSSRDPGFCELEFSGSKLKSPLTETNNHLHGIADIAATLIRLL